MLAEVLSADGGIRTPTPVKAPGPKPGASASSATSAWLNLSVYWVDTQTRCITLADSGPLALIIMTIPGLPTSQTASSGFGFDIYQQLLQERIVFLGREVDDEIANSIAAQMLYLAGLDPDKDIWLYINSPGGSVSAGMAIYDTMQFVRPDIATVCLGLGASMGQFLLTAGAKGKRYALPHARILMHQPSAGVRGQAVDIAIQAQNLVQIKRETAELIAKHSGRDVEEIVADSDRDRWFTAQEACEYGLFDRVISRAGELSDS